MGTFKLRQTLSLRSYHLLSLQHKVVDESLNLISIRYCARSSLNLKEYCCKSLLLTRIILLFGGALRLSSYMLLGEEPPQDAGTSLEPGPTWRQTGALTHLSYAKSRQAKPHPCYLHPTPVSYTIPLLATPHPPEERHIRAEVRLA